jgi:FMN-dependent oxidoreductase (nitrilotriacetate monooxygenase family)
MTKKKFHLGWFTSFAATEWNSVYASSDLQHWNGEFYIELAKALERACFDYIMFEDALMLPEAYGGSAEAYLKLALMAPKHDPAPLTALVAAATKSLGIVTTLSTMAYPPYMLARLCCTLDHIAGGRFGWNIVTTGEDGAAQNFGMEKLPGRELRYEMADEYLELVNQLFSSWDPNAITLDHDKGIYADYTKVRPINFRGKFFSCRGPLNTAPSPQGRPAYVQAGGSPRGRKFAATHADSIIATAQGIEGMKAYRAEVRKHAAAIGRDPDEIKVLFLVAPVVGETEENAKAKYLKGVSSPQSVQRSLALISSITDIDFSQFQLDAPLPLLKTNGEQGSLDRFQQAGSGKTLRQLILEGGGTVTAMDLIGTPDQIADQMEEAIEKVGGDGFLIRPPFGSLSRRYLNEITEGLVPVLQRRGLTRNAYTPGRTLRNLLREF